MDINHQALSHILASSSKRVPADLVIKNGKIIDVFNLAIMEADVAITDGKIVGIGHYEGNNQIDADGAYICPGLIDGHVHIESSMVTPQEFARVVVPHGVTTVIADPHEIANVSGKEGIDYMIKTSEQLPLDVYIALPSCVPATPFEHAGAELKAPDLEPYYSSPRVIGLGEVMNYPAVFQGDSDMLKKLAGASNCSRHIDGHASGVSAEGINVYMAAGIRTDHECVTPQEVKERLMRGMYVMLREGSAARDLTLLLDAVEEKNARRCLFVTDDKHLDDLIENGSIDHNIRLTIEKGFDPLLAIQMATLNAAECFGLKQKGAIAPGYDADLVLLTDLTSFKIQQVYKKGMLAAAQGVMLPFQNEPSAPPPVITNSVHLLRVSEESLSIPMKSGMANVIKIIPNSIVTKHVTEEVSILDSCFNPDLNRDLLKLVVAERHHLTGNIGCGILKGLGITSGAIVSTVAHDSHNIVAAGTNDRDLLKAIEVIAEMRGGLAVIEKGEVLASLPLPIAGLMSDKNHKEVYQKLQEIHSALKTIGFTHDFNPFLTLSFLALPVIPELKLTDMGLFDVISFQHISAEYKKPPF
ncbi:adenine deaminase [Fictibacillus terranigra]|uniref:Adenine deaminase n=1 Tax=Fictibacillus terranigra TaxID=3058424 RepID=A0ABT8E7P7_9BACL|nr:adenine deaminase [Fictibacillus sp. CENA-BCM004]MDN4073948.1 adenine deaminase [Fictibacillus sp. CENA-BCM004]